MMFHLLVSYMVAMLLIECVQDTDQIILPCINVCTELPAENRFRLD